MTKIKISIRAVLIVCVLLVVASFAAAQGSERAARTQRCSNRTLSGDYGAKIEGTILGPDLQLRTISMMHYDGAGNFTEVAYVVVNGVLPTEEWRPASGTYSVNPDCTGTAAFSVAPGNPPLSIHFVLVKHGKEIHAVVDGGAITLSAYKVD
jgi:hypothetical protein